MPFPTGKTKIKPRLYSSNRRGLFYVFLLNNRFQILRAGLSSTTGWLLLACRYWACPVVINAFSVNSCCFSKSAVIRSLYSANCLSLLRHSSRNSSTCLIKKSIIAVSRLSGLFTGASAFSTGFCSISICGLSVACAGFNNSVDICIMPLIFFVYASFCGLLAILYASCLLIPARFAYSATLIYSATIG